MARLSLFLLGSMQVKLGDALVTEFPTSHCRALLAYLAVESDQPHHRESLATLLWPERPDQAARANLRRALSDLRRTLGNSYSRVGLEEPLLFLADRETIQLDPDSDHWLDVDEFLTLLENQESDLEDIQRALDLYRGAFLEDLYVRNSPDFEEWCLLMRGELQRRAVEALSTVARRGLEQGDYSGTMAAARRITSLDPLNEEAARLLMRALALDGERNGALAAYEEFRQVLEEELGVEPTQETTALYLRIHDGNMQPRSEQVGPTCALPVAPGRFVGRHKELEQIVRYLHDPNCRLLSLVGSGGSGKTRLAIEAAARLERNFRDGACFVLLSAVRSLDALVPTIAQALGLSAHDRGGPDGIKELLFAHLGDMEALLVLDNVEQLAKGGFLFTELLNAAPRIKILTTSRTKLNLRDEQVLPIVGLDYSADEVRGDATRDERQERENSAMALFLETAQRLQPEIRPTQDDLVAIAKICTMVEGMPLAILLAAAWVPLLSPVQIVDQLESQALDFLTAEWRDVPPRQQSMRQVLEQTWALLSEREQEVFSELSLFRNAFTLEGAKRIATATPQDLMALVNKSILHRVTTNRYAMHELLRQFAYEQLEKRVEVSPASPSSYDAVHERYASYFVEQMERCEAEMVTGRSQSALSSMDSEIEDAHAAWEWMITQGQVSGLDRGANGLGFYYEGRQRYVEGEAAFGAAVARMEDRRPGELPDPVRLLLAKLLSWRGAFLHNLGNPGRAIALSERALGLLSSVTAMDENIWRRRASILQRMGPSLLATGDLRVWEVVEEAAQLYQKLGDHWGMVEALHALGWIARYWDRYEEAKEFHTRELAMRREQGDPRPIAAVLRSLGGIALVLGDLKEAERLHRESMAIVRDRQLSGPSPHLLGMTLVYAGRPGEALPILEESVSMFPAEKTPYQVGLASSALATGHLHLGQYEEVAALAERHLQAAKRVPWERGVGLFCCLLGSVALARDEHVQALERLEQSIAAHEKGGTKEELAMAKVTSAYGALAEEGRAQAGTYLADALRTATEIKAFWPPIAALPALALLYAQESQMERAMELYGLAWRFPFVANSAWFRDVAGEKLAAIAKALPPDVVAAAQERGRSADLASTLASILGELEDRPS